MAREWSNVQAQPGPQGEKYTPRYDSTKIEALSVVHNNFVYTKNLNTPPVLFFFSIFLLNGVVLRFIASSLGHLS